MRRVIARARNLPLPARQASPAEPCFAQDGFGQSVAVRFADSYAASSAPPRLCRPSRRRPIDRAVIFFVELDSGQTCAIRAAAEPVVLDAGTAGYEVRHALHLSRGRRDNGLRR